MMKYWEMFKEENEAVKERHELALERIGQFKTEETVAEPYRSYFRKAAEFIMLAEKVYGMQERGELEALSLDEAKKLNIKLYEDVLPGNYEESFCNPAFAVAALGRDFGQYLAFLLTEIRGMIVYAYESRLTDMTILEEVLIEVYNLFESEEPELKEVKEVLYYFVSDYCDVMLTYRVRETLDPSLDFAKSIIMDSDLTDLRYLYRFGEYISDSELKIAAFLNSLPEETVRKMADTYTEGIRKGFVASGRSYKSKKTVQIRYHIGFERMIRMAVENFRKLGLEPVISRAAVGTVNRAAARTNGYHGTPANRQYDYDHRYDNAIYMDKAFKERKLSVLKVAYEECRTLAKAYAGPAVLETFGEEGFTPENKKEAFALSEKQEKLLLSYSNESMQIADAYVPGMETSFTIIAFPLPEIGDNFEKIFEETIRINTLDYELYRDIQQCIIDALDQADHVMVYGMGENRTKLKVALRRLKNPAKETNFENCVAEVMNLAGDYSELAVRRALKNSKVLSSDVSAAFDPNYPSVMEKKNSAYFGKGLVFNKYTGARGKSGSNDANAEYVARLRNIMDTADVSFQTAELGKVDEGGGGTIAYILANYDMNVIDSGVPVLNMHAPWEIISKVDLYEAFRGYIAFLKEA